MAPSEAADATNDPRLRRVARWLFVNRQNGQITVAQRPNASLCVFIVCWAVSFIFSPSGRPGEVVRVLATGALVWWSSDELVRGVNPFRRVLGLAVLVSAIVSLYMRVH